MSFTEQLRQKFPEINVISNEDEHTSDNPMITFGCRHHKNERSEKFKKLLKRKYSCLCCAKLLNKGHAFNLDQEPLKAKKIIEIDNIFSNRFCYRKFSSIDVMTPSTIICKDHGEMEVSIIEHLMAFNLKGCKACEAGEDKSYNYEAEKQAESLVLKNKIKQEETINQAPPPKNWMSLAKQQIKSNAFV